MYQHLVLHCYAYDGHNRQPLVYFTLAFSLPSTYCLLLFRNLAMETNTITTEAISTQAASRVLAIPELLTLIGSSSECSVYRLCQVSCFFKSTKVLHFHISLLIAFSPAQSSLTLSQILRVCQAAPSN